jgi:hypothetical protein
MPHGCRAEIFVARISGFLEHRSAVEVPLATPLPMSLPAAEARTRSSWYGPQRPQLPATLGGQQQHLTGAVAGEQAGCPSDL